MAAKDYYAILGVPKGASQKDIRQAYRKLARQHHPDVNAGDKSSEAKFKEINAANEVLSDPEKRKKYDRYGDQWQYADQIEEMQRQQGARGGRTFRGGDGANIRYEFRGDPNDLGDLGDLGSIFGDMFAGRGRGRSRSPRPRAVEQPIGVTLEEAFHGTTRTLQIAQEEICQTCGGTGEIAGAMCHVCQGSGVVIKPRRIEVRIPAGVDNGSRVRVAGEGGANADLYLIVSVRPHPRFERKGADVYTDIEVPLTTAVLGGEVEVPTVTGGKLALTIPPLSQNGRTFRLGGQGMPKLGSKERGNLYARLRVKLPDKLDERERTLFEELRALETSSAKASA